MNNNIKYIKISLDNIEKCSEFIKYYVEDYIRKIDETVVDLPTFIKKNEFDLNYYKRYDDNVKIYFNLLYDKENNNFFALEKTIWINNNFFDISYFKELPLTLDIDKLEIKNVIYAVDLYIHPDYRGKKMCSYLLHRIYKNGMKHDCSIILSEINESNKLSIKCHYSNGFIKTNIFKHQNTFVYYKLLALQYMDNKQIEKKTYIVQKNGSIPEEYFYKYFNTNKNWQLSDENLSKYNFMYDFGKNSWNKITEIGSPFDPYHRQFITNKSALYHVFNKYFPEKCNQYMMKQYDVDLNDVNDIDKYKKLFDNKIIYILKPTWGFSRRGILIFSKFDDFKQYMIKIGINELKKAKHKVKEFIIKYVLAEFLQNQLLSKGHVFNLRVFWIMSMIDNKYRSYLNKYIILHRSENKLSSVNNLNLDELISASTDEAYITDLNQEIGEKNTNAIINQIIDCCIYLYKIVLKTKCLKLYENRNHSFEIFGIDFIVEKNNDNYMIKLVELNDRVGLDNYFPEIYDSLIHIIIKSTVNKLYDPIFHIKLNKQYASNIVKIKAN